MRIYASNKPALFEDLWNSCLDLELFFLGGSALLCFFYVYRCKFFVPFSICFCDSEFHMDSYGLGVLGSNSFMISYSLSEGQGHRFYVHSYCEGALG